MTEVRSSPKATWINLFCWFNDPHKFAHKGFRFKDCPVNTSCKTFPITVIRAVDNASVIRQRLVKLLEVVAIQRQNSSILAGCERQNFVIRNL